MYLKKVFNPLLLLIILSSCTLLKNMDKNRLYTIEGRAYELKVADRYIQSTVIAVPTTPLGQVYINRPDSFALDVFSLDLGSNKKVIPISYALSVIDDNTEQVLVDINTPYIRAIDVVNSSNINNSRLYLSKIYPYVSLNYFTDNNFYSYTTRYNDVIFSDNDFVDPYGPIILSNSPTLAEAFTFRGLPTYPNNLPAGTYSINVSFTYFEMVNN